MNRFLDISFSDLTKYLKVDPGRIMSWQGHIPFAFSLIKIFNPRCFVELGTYAGDSYLAFCEAVKRNGLEAKCYAVDTWKGDEHSGHYGEEVFEDLMRRHDVPYGSFSRLMRTTFDAAATEFQDGSIDLLHIDGLHTIEAVSHDFETWKPKLSARGIVLFHDTAEDKAGFGVREYWSKLKTEYPSFEFYHSSGLGVLAVGRNAARDLPDLFSLDAATAGKIRDSYKVLGNAASFGIMEKVLSDERSASEALKSENKRISDLLSETTGQLEMAKEEIFGVREEFNSLLNSRSWRLARFLCNCGETCRSVPRITGGSLRLLGKAVYKAIPFSPPIRHAIKRKLHGLFPGLFAEAGQYGQAGAYFFYGSFLPEKFSSPGIPGEPFDLILPEKPLVSVIIPVFGKAEYTYQCLRSLMSHMTGYSFEVIVVDDASSDITREMLNSIGGIRVIRNDRNEGFVRSCNAGARAAKGRLLVMLNNDTIVRPGWLDELVETFNCVPSAGLVGSKLVYPDGRLQEAGGIIWQDGSGCNYGRMQDPESPEYNYMRDVDYCSGASIMIEKELFDSLGGFDESFSPAYGEDSDLAFRVREAGRRVIYQPLSRVVHFEGVTCGKDTSGGVKSYQKENTARLYEKWKERIREHALPGIGSFIEKDRYSCGRVLVIDHCTPRPDQDAGSITALNIMRILLGMGYKVTFAPEDNFLFLAPYTRDMQRMGIECLYSPFVTSLEEHLAKYGKTYDIVITFRMTAAERNIRTIKRHCPDAKYILHTSDLHHLREGREAELVSSDSLRRKAKKTKEKELAIVRLSDAVIVHSTVEKTMLEEELNSKQEDSRICLFPWAIDIPGRTRSFDGRDGILFVAGFQHLPNKDAAVYFVKEIFPLVRKKLPGTFFRVVGSHIPDDVRDLAGHGVDIAGYVEDLASEMDRARITVVPLRYGAGIKGKIGTSLSYGVPCVSTSIGAEGMSLSPGDGVLVGDDPDVFASRVAELYEDKALWESSSTGGLAFVKKNYSLEAGMDTMKHIINVAGVSYSPEAKKGIPSMAAYFRKTAKYEPDRRKDAMMDWKEIKTKEEYDKWSVSHGQMISRNREKKVMMRHVRSDRFLLNGYCRVCGRDVGFKVDKECGSFISGGTWVPNWRERLVCPVCGLNNRQRAIASVLQEIAVRRSDKVSRAYLTEKMTSFYLWAEKALPNFQLEGSEYLGGKYSPGSVVGGIRHEDICRLSFTDGIFDIVVTNEVLEHVPDPLSAVRELCRVMKKQASLIMTVPLYLDRDKSFSRARLVSGAVEHIAEPIYHGDPLTGKGSLVFTDFGWDLIKMLENGGFRDVSMKFYWSEVYGHLGPAQHYIHAVKR